MIMDWEMLLALVGLYILLTTVLVYHWLASRRMMEINEKIYESMEGNKKVLESVRAIETYILEKVYKKEK